MIQPAQILVADDREDNRDLMVQVLGSGYRVTQAAGGRQAIACIESDRPDLLILDLIMPESDGFAVLKYLADHPGAFLPVIVVSAAPDRDARIRAFKMGAHEYLARPFEPEELLIRVKTVLSLKEARQAAERKAHDLEAMVAERTGELRLALESLQERDRYKDEFLSVMSHELRTPLNFILGSASTLEDGAVGELSEPQRTLVGYILKGADRMMELVTNLLDMSLLAAGKFTLAPTSERYEPLVEQALDELRPLAQKKGVTLSKDLCVPERVLLDEQRTVQVLTNLIGNALKFTNAGGQVAVKAYLRDGRLVTEVADTGIGIPPDDVPRLFQPLKQLDMTSTREFGGAGLGLSISKGIVEAHGGEIGVRSAPGVGSTFWFALPVNQRQEAGASP